MSGARPASSGAPSPPLPFSPARQPARPEPVFDQVWEGGRGDRDGDGGEGVAAIFALDVEEVTTPEQVRDSDTFKDRGSS